MGGSVGGDSAQKKALPGPGPEFPRDDVFHLQNKAEIIVGEEAQGTTVAALFPRGRKDDSEFLLASSLTRGNPLDFQGRAARQNANETKGLGPRHPNYPHLLLVAGDFPEPERAGFHMEPRLHLGPDFKTRGKAGTLADEVQGRGFFPYQPDGGEVHHDDSPGAVLQRHPRPEGGTIEQFDARIKTSTGAFQAVDADGSIGNKRKANLDIRTRDQDAQIQGPGFKFQPGRSDRLLSASSGEQQQKRRQQLPMHPVDITIRAVPLPLPALLILFLTVSCQSIPVAVHARVLAPDFTNPVVAGESFLAAVACDDARAEYLCFAESLKESHGATLDGWVLARESLREDLGSSLKHAHLLRPAPGELHRTLIWWEHEGKRHIGLQMERQPFFDILHQGSQKAGSFLSAPPSYFLNIEEDKLTLGLRDSVLRGLISSDVDGLVLGTEWKVAGFLFP